MGNFYRLFSFCRQWTFCGLESFKGFLEDRARYLLSSPADQVAWEFFYLLRTSMKNYSFRAAGEAPQKVQETILYKPYFKGYLNSFCEESRKCFCHVSFTKIYSNNLKFWKGPFGKTLVNCQCIYVSHIIL